MNLPAKDRLSAPEADWPVWPVFGVESDLLPRLQAWHAQGRRIVMATLVKVVGSSPRPVGSEMAINDLGEVIGYVSGGCVEAEVAAQARQVLATGQPVTLYYGKGSPVLDIQLTCGGGIGLFLWPLTPLEDYLQARGQALVSRSTLDFWLNLDSGQFAFGDRPGHWAGNLFGRRFMPKPRLVVVGRDPVSLALCELAPGLGLEVLLLCPKGPPTPPPQYTLNGYDPRPIQQALADVRLDAWSAIYTLTHNLDDDHAALSAGLASEAFAVGALGSRKKAETRWARLREAGFDEAAIARVNCPAGLDIGARDPREIALSILAEVVASKSREQILRAAE